MKTLTTIIVTAVTGLTLATSGSVLAQGWGRGGDPAFSPPRGAHMGAFVRDEMRQTRVAVLAEVTGQTEATIEAKLRNKPVWAVLDEYKVEFATYQAKMHEKHVAAIEKAVAEGKITKAQGDFMLERMKEGPQGFAGKGGRGSEGGFARGGNCWMR